jgi:hypothetical protein
MPATYSPNLRFELPGDGEQSGIWGQTTNNNIGALIEQAISGLTSIDVTAASVTLTAFNGTVDESRSAVITVTGSPAAARNIVIPNEPKCYTVLNNTGVAVTIKTTSGTGYACLANSQSTVQCDGVGTGTTTGMTISTVANALTSSSDLATTAASVGLAKLNSPAFTGTPTAPTAVVGTNNTQLATTAFVQAEIAADTTGFAPLASPTFTGVPAAPTASVSTNTTQLATTAFVVAQVANDAPTKTGTGATGTWNISVTGNAATATNATNAVNSTTQVPGTNNTTIATTAFTTAAIAAIPTPTTIIPPGTVMLFAQAAAPTGWTQVTTQNDKALRVVSGTGGGTGGSVAFTTAFSSQNVGATALSTTQIPSHNHSFSGTTSGIGDHVHNYTAIAAVGGSSFAGGGQGTITTTTSGAGAHDHSYSGTTSSTGSGSTHTHTLNLAVQYVDIILASKD